MAQDTPSRKLAQYIIRFPNGMRDRLKQAAADNNRSMNAELVDRLEKSFAADERARGSNAYLSDLILRSEESTGPVKMLNSNELENAEIRHAIMTATLRAVEEVIGKMDARGIEIFEEEGNQSD